MRLNFRKIGAIAAGALMVGLTMGTAAANYPAPFVTGNGPDVAIVYGTGSGVSSLDLVQAASLQGNLQSYMSSGGGNSAVSTSGGDSKVLSTSTRKLYYGDAISAPIPSLTYGELPTVLASGTFTDLSGTAYGYTQTVKVGPAAITFGNDGGNYNDPTLYIYATTTAGNLYNYSVSFTKNLNVSDAVNVEGQKINLQGIDYVIGSSSTSTTLYLYGSGTDVTVAGGATQPFTVGGTPHTVQLVTTSSSTAIISVDGVSKTVTQGSNYAFAGGINVYVKTIINPAFAGDVRQVELIVGASSLKLTNGQTVKVGADQTTIQGTQAIVTSAGTSDTISGFSVLIAASKSQNDSIAVGGSFVDPVFGGLKLTFADEVPPLKDASRAQIMVDAGTGTSQYVYTTFTSARAGAAGAQKLAYVYDNTTAGTSVVQPLLAHSSSVNSNGRGMIHVLEGEQARLNDWIIVNQGDAGTILQVDDMSYKDDSSGTVTLTDAITGQSQIITLTNASNVTGSGYGYYRNSNVNAWGGTGYNINVNGAWTMLNISWNSGATAVFPRIKLANGDWMAFLAQTTVANGTSVIFPDGQSTLITGGTTVGTSGSLNSVPNGINWTLSPSASTTKITGIGNPNCNFNSTYGPAILYIEQKKWNDPSYGNFICIPLTSTSSSEQMALSTPVFNGTNSGWVSLGSINTEQQAVDQYGAFAVKDTPTNSNGQFTVYTPNSQMYFDVLFSSIGTSVAGGTTAVAGGQLGNVLVKDSEVSSVSGKNLIVVGGSCINSVASSLLGGAGCGASFTSATNVGQGQFLIQSLASPYTSGKVALVVAGYEAGDTVNAATFLQTQAVDTTVGKKYIGTSATSAQLVTTSTP